MVLYIIGQSLPFGSTASVYSFNKTAKALRFLLWRDAGILTTNLHDDFSTLELEKAAENTTQVMSGFSNSLDGDMLFLGRRRNPFHHALCVSGVLCTRGRTRPVRATCWVFCNWQQSGEDQRIERQIDQAAKEKRVSQTSEASTHGLFHVVDGS